ncbi:MAG: hypothetical protein CME71_11305 [Halobacteriovorax sp.]|nr:hypothetical protein [Halobacteriovorax sp.]|tara:strand:+ start:1188 stop:2057 length:870 start_codon:yes stop_codon:yes gene_type:complete
MNITYDNFEEIIEQGLSTENVSLRDLKWIEPVGVALLKTMYQSQLITNLSDTESVQSSARAYIRCLTNTPATDSERTYVTLTEFSQDLFPQSEDALVQGVVNNILHNTGSMEARDREDLRLYLIYLLGEIVRNIKDHSQSQHSYIAAQFYPSHRKTQVVIVDSGIGLRASLERRYPEIQTHSDAILKAIEPFATGVAPNSNPYGGTTNIGLGLHMSTELIKLTKNRLKMISGDSKLTIANRKTVVTNLPFTWNGTIVTFEIFEHNLQQEFGELFDYIRGRIDQNGISIF